jgi:hypothetical protein
LAEQDGAVFIPCGGFVKGCRDVSDDGLDSTSLFVTARLERGAASVPIRANQANHRSGRSTKNAALVFRLAGDILVAIEQTIAARMSKPVIFTISAAWDDEASVWSGHCDDIPAAADAPTLDELLAKISAMALDLLPDNHPDIDPASLYLQITALREAEPTAA